MGKSHYRHCLCCVDFYVLLWLDKVLFLCISSLVWKYFFQAGNVFCNQANWGATNTKNLRIHDPVLYPTCFSWFNLKLFISNTKGDKPFVLGIRINIHRCSENIPISMTIQPFPFSVVLTLSVKDSSLRPGLGQIISVQIDQSLERMMY